MKWTPQQDAALRTVAAWAANGSQQVFCLFGYAGTGKTTLAAEVASGIDGTVLSGAYTGKAAYMLRQRGLPGATTIHSLIYRTREKGLARLKELELELTDARSAAWAAQPELNEEEVDRLPRVAELLAEVRLEREAMGRPTFLRNPDSAVRDARLVIVDECSMIDDAMGADLLSYGTKILVLGDPAQLPPVMGGGYFTNRQPDLMLTEIHRQARDNPIIELATRTREGVALELGTYGSSSVVEASTLTPDDALGADQLLVGRNKTKHSYNKRLRQLLGRTDNQPVPGDRLVCLRNNHEIGLLNGALWNVVDVGEVSEDRVFMQVSPEDGGNLLDVEAHMHHFQGRSDRLSWWERKEAEEFDYGYAMTVHKSQGSQFGRVLLFDESRCFRADCWKWLYTGITRAVESVRVVRL
jgi:exodeoxyribonuclease-5